MQWASHGHTAAEIIYERANSEKIFMGLTSFNGNYPLLEDEMIAKNYLNEKELDILNRIVSMYLDYAELQAIEEKSMKDWIEQLDYFLKMNRKDILITKGNVSNNQAINKAKREYKKYKNRIVNEPSDVEVHYIESIDKLKSIEVKE